MPSARETALLHAAEQWRERLIASDEAVAQWINSFPGTDTQQLRALVRQARKDYGYAATDALWPVGTTESYKPFAFMRNVGTGNSWNASGNYWKPASGPGVTATAYGVCSGNCGRGTHGNYTPGGVY